MIKKNDVKYQNTKLIIKIALTFFIFIIFAALSDFGKLNVYLLAVALFVLNGFLWIITDKLYDFFSLKLSGRSSDLNDPILQNITLQFI